MNPGTRTWEGAGGRASAWAQAVLRAVPCYAVQGNSVQWRCDSPSIPPSLPPSRLLLCCCAAIRAWHQIGRSRDLGRQIASNPRNAVDDGCIQSLAICNCAITRTTPRFCQMGLLVVRRRWKMHGGVSNISRSLPVSPSPGKAVCPSGGDAVAEIDIFIHLRVRWSFIIDVQSF